MAERVVIFFLAALLTACTSSYTIKIDGDVMGSQPTTPRVVKAGIYTGPEAPQALAAAGGTLVPLGDATVAISVLHDRTWKFQSRTSQVGKLPVVAGHVHVDGHGETSGPVEALQLVVQAPGRAPVMRQIPVKRGEPIDVSILAVLDRL